MSGDVRALLDQLDQAHDEASRARWGLLGGTHDRTVIDDHGCHVATTGTFPDAALIVAAANALPRLVAAVRAVADLADELDEDLDSYGYRIRNGLDPTPGDRLRAALAPLTAEDQA